MQREPIISFRNFSFQYYSQSEPTLTDINLDIYPGEKILIAGPSGSGKSTLAHCINGLIPFAYKGEIQGSLKVGGEETRNMNIFRLSKTVGTVLQDSDGQFVGLTVGEDIAFALENDCVEQREMKDRVRKIAAKVGMENLLAQAPFELSGGQKQRTALAGVLIDNVDVLLFDEPLANLDPATGKSAIEIIDEIHERDNKTIIVIEHRLEDVLYRHVDRIILVDDGRIISDSSADSLLSSGLLKKTGIREPLYITALKFAGISIEPEKLPGSLDTLILDEADKEKLRLWQLSLPKPAPEKPSDEILKLRGIDFSYSGKENALEGVDLTVYRGELLSVIGKNGAGKSTLSKLICGFEKQDRGTIFSNSSDLARYSIKERAEKIGVVMQNPNQMISKSMIYDEVVLGLRLRGCSEDEIRPRAEKALRICGLAPFTDWPVAALSYGQKKRVTIASILVLEPDIIILDEPTAGQDYRHYTEIMEFLTEINKSGVTVIMITHDMHLMLEYTPRAIVMCDGHILKDASAAEILTDPELIAKANLKETSLYTLSKLTGIEDGTSFVQSFIDFERSMRK
jgi:energy-coupling factor transport system ATP-binding protein